MMSHLFALIVRATRTVILPCCILFAMATAHGQEASPKNIVFIMADDLGWSDTSSGRTNLGNPSDFFETPTIARLAGQGMAFTNAYAAGPNCAPTRAALLTGQYAARPNNKVFNVGGLNRGGNNTILVGPAQGLPNGQDEIPGSAVTIAETLKTVGYKTAHLGKYHVGGSMRGVNDPLSQGFDFNFGGGSPGGPGAYHAANSSTGWRFGGNIGPELDTYATPYTQQYIDQNLKPYANGANVDSLVATAKHVSDAMTDAAIDFMNNHDDQPFYLQFHPYAVHSPIGNAQARADLLAKYQDKDQTQPSQIGDNNVSYAALIEGLDQNIARLTHYLETTDDPRNPGRKLSENTLVIFYSDNGGKQNQANNGPLKGEKGELSEGGVRVPMIAWGPGVVPAGSVNHTPVTSVDFYTTFAALAGASSPSGVTLDGEDLTPILRDSNTALQRNAIYWHFPGYLIGSGRDQRPQTAMRSNDVDGQWKLIYNYEDASWELYNLAMDIGELNNLAPEKPLKVFGLGALMVDWLKDFGYDSENLLNDGLALPTFRNQTLYADGVLYAAGDETPLPILPSVPEPTSLTLMGAGGLLTLKRPGR